MANVFQKIAVEPLIDFRLVFIVLTKCNRDSARNVVSLLENMEHLIQIQNLGGCVRRSQQVFHVDQEYQDVSRIDAVKDSF